MTRLQINVDTILFSNRQFYSFFNTTYTVIGLLAPSRTFTYYKVPERGGVLPYMGHIGMCGPKVYGFSAVSRS